VKKAAQEIVQNVKTAREKIDKTPKKQPIPDRSMTKAECCGGLACFLLYINRERGNNMRKKENEVIQCV